MPKLIQKVRNFATQGNLGAKVERLRNYTDLRLQRERVESHPSTLYIETCTACNLRCPFCPTGNGTLGLARELLTPENFDLIMGNIHVRHLTRVHLYNWGEPLMNPNLADYIEFFSRRNIFSTISTNFSVKDYDEAFLDQLVRSGLDELFVSIDGATQATYERYRVRGDLDRVLRNMRLLDRVKKSLGASNPKVYYRMLLNRFNEGEAEAASRLAEEAGAEFILNDNFHVPAAKKEEWIAPTVEEKYGSVLPTMYGRSRREIIHTECRQMWDTLVVNANGDMLACCLVDDAGSALGNLTRQHVDEIWNGEKTRALRKFAIDAEEDAPSFRNYCGNCSNRYCTHNAPPKS